MGLDLLEKRVGRQWWYSLCEKYCMDCSEREMERGDSFYLLNLYP